VNVATLEEEIVSAPDEPFSVRLASKYAAVTAAQAQHERRQYWRWRDRDLDWVERVRLRTAGQVALIDLSAGGALIDSPVPLRPGAALTLEIVGRSTSTVIVPLHVLRCQVSALLADSARYRGALEFIKPIELPDLSSLATPLPAAADPFSSVDSALKRIVERAYGSDSSQRLAAGDVTLALQSLASRTLAMDDAFGRHLGHLLQELVPTLRQDRALPEALRAIERRLSQVLPQARIRLVDSSAPAPANVRSVLINMPATVATAGSVAIDLPPTAVINDAQARLLRTSSRLIALAQRLTLPASPSPAAAPPAVVEPESSQAGVWQKVVVRYADGQLLKGFTQDFHGSKSQFSLWPTVNAAADQRVVVPLARLKAVFFVREFGGNPDHVESKVFEASAHGRRIEVTLLDDEVLVGTTLNYRSDSAGFFVFPADPRANNQRVFVVASAVRQVRFP
jgi:hypothetical protein